MPDLVKLPRPMGLTLYETHRQPSLEKVPELIDHLDELVREQERRHRHWLKQAASVRLRLMRSMSSEGAG